MPTLTMDMALFYCTTLRTAMRRTRRWAGSSLRSPTIELPRGWIPDGDTYARVCRAVVEVPAALKRHESFDKRRPRGVLPRPLVTLGWPDKRAVRPCNELGGIPHIKQCLPSGIR